MTDSLQYILDVRKQDDTDEISETSICNYCMNITYKQGSKYILWMEIEGETSPSIQRKGVVKGILTPVSDTLGFKSWLFH